LLIKYEELKDPLFKKRSEIISGVYEPKKTDLPDNKELEPFEEKKSEKFL